MTWETLWYLFPFFYITKRKKCGIENELPICIESKMEREGRVTDGRPIQKKKKFTARRTGTLGLINAGGLKKKQTPDVAAL